MAKGAQKRIASANAQATSTLLYGLAATNAVFWIAHTLLWPTSAWRTWTLYVLSEGVAGALALQLLSMARAGDDLRQRGLTAYVKGTHGRYMWDVVYLTWFVHVAVSLVSPVFWWTYATVRRQAHARRCRCMGRTYCTPRSSHPCAAVAQRRQPRRPPRTSPR